VNAVADFIHPRGEVFSALVVAAVLTFAAPRIAGLVDLERRRVADLFWNAGVAFVVAGRAAYLLNETPRTLLDPLVAIRIQGGIEPLVGALASACVLAWMLRRGAAAAGPAWLTAWALGLAVAATSYDLACPLRDACYGAQVPAPLGFSMSGFADTRLATPLVEAAILLGGLGLLVQWWPRWRPGVPGLLLLGAVAGLRLALTPLSVAGWPGVTPEVLALAMVVAMALAGVVVLQATPSTGDHAATGVPDN
jgi:hypothetical protein